MLLIVICYEFYYVYRECVWLENYYVNLIFFYIFSGFIISKSIFLKIDFYDYSNINNLLVKVNVIVFNKYDIKDIVENFVILMVIFLGFNILICFVWIVIVKIMKIFWVYVVFFCVVGNFCVVYNNLDWRIYFMSLFLIV